MSMQTTMIYGYGFTCENIREDAFKVFIETHKDTIREHGSKDEQDLLKEIIDNPECDLDELEENFPIEDFGSFNESLYSVISNIIYYETNIRVGFYRGSHDEIDCDSSIMLPQNMPWDFSETEKKLTKTELHDILAKYADELYMPKPEEITMEYFG